MRTMAVWDLKMRRKTRRGSASPIQYMPLSILYSFSAGLIATLTGSWLTIRATSTSTLRFGFALYTVFFLGSGEG